MRLDYGLAGARGPAGQDGRVLIGELLTRKPVQPISRLLLISEVGWED